MPRATKPWRWNLGRKGIPARSDSRKETYLIFPDSVLFPVLLWSKASSIHSSDLLMLQLILDITDDKKKKKAQDVVAISEDLIV